MARKKKQTQAEAAPEVATQPAEPISKMEAVRQALLAGRDMPTEGLAFIKAQFGLEMSKSHFSNYKSSIRGKKGKKRGRKPGPKAVPEMLAVTVIDLGDMPEEGGIDIGTIEQVKALCDRYGAGTVKRLVELVG